MTSIRHRDGFAAAGSPLASQDAISVFERTPAVPET